MGSGDDQAASEHHEYADLDHHERMELLKEAAIQAEYATGKQEDTRAAAKRHIVVRMATIVVGSIVLVAGVVMMALPGPGIVTVLAGLAILSRELAWAERMMEYVQKKAKIDELKAQPKWIQALTWGLSIAAVAASLVYWFIIR